EELRSRGHVFEGVRYGTPDGTETGRIDAGPLIDAAGGRYFSILRPEVELGLLAALPGNVDLRHGARAVAVRATAPRRAAVAHAAGTELAGDRVVAGGGVRSPVREHGAPGHGEIIPMGYRAAGYLFEDPDLARELGERMLMTDTVQRTGWLYAADASRVGVMFTERVDRRDASRPTPDPDRLRRRFAGLHPQIDRALTRAPESFYDDLVAQSH